jgi:hypothetical protein
MAPPDAEHPSIRPCGDAGVVCSAPERLMAYRIIPRRKFAGVYGWKRMGQGKTDSYFSVPIVATKILFGSDNVKYGNTVLLMHFKPYLHDDGGIQWKNACF